MKHAERPPGLPKMLTPPQEKKRKTQPNKSPPAGCEHELDCTVATCGDCTCQGLALAFIALPGSASYLTNVVDDMLLVFISRHMHGSTHAYEHASRWT